MFTFIDEMPKCLSKSVFSEWHNRFNELIGDSGLLMLVKPLTICVEFSNEIKEETFGSLTTE